MKTRRHALALAAALTATLLTAVAAIGGLAHRATPVRSATPAVVQTAPQAPARFGEDD